MLYRDIHEHENTLLEGVRAWTRSRARYVANRTLGLTKLAPKGFCFNQQRQSR